LSRDATTEAELREALQRNPLPLALVELEMMRIIDVNAAARAMVGGEGALALPLALDVIMPAEEEQRARHALRLIAAGEIQAYETRSRVQRADGSVISGRAWVRSLAHIRAGIALAVFLADSEIVGPDPATGSELAELQLPGTRVATSLPIAIATIGLDTTIKRISTESAELLGDTSANLIGRPLVDVLHPDDVAAFLLAMGRSLEDNTGVGMHVRVKRVRAYIAIRILVTPTEGPTGTRFGVVFAPEGNGAPSAQDRIDDLENHLWRIAVEVQAAGVAEGMHRVPDEVQVPALADLSSRQWELLTRVVRGDSIDTIARALHVDTETVEHHLATILRKLDLSSREDLVAMFRAPDEGAT